MPDPAPNPTADYRKYPKGPNFSLIVVLFAIVIVVMLALGVLFFHTKAGKKADPYKPNPTPNSSLRQDAGPRGLV